MAHCIHCFSKIPESATYCTVCGAFQDPAIVAARQQQAQATSAPAASQQPAETMAMPDFPPVMPTTSISTQPASDVGAPGTAASPAMGPHGVGAVPPPPSPSVGYSPYGTPQQPANYPSSQPTYPTGPNSYGAPSFPPHYGQIPMGVYPNQQTESSINGLSIAGFVVGLIALLFFWFPVFSPLMGITGLGLSIGGISKAKNGLGIAGLVISAVTSFLGCLITLVCFTSF